MRLTEVHNSQMDTKTEADEPPLLDPKDIDRGITIVILGI